MEISKLTEDQAIDMGIVEAAIRQAERAEQEEISYFLGDLLFTTPIDEMSDYLI